jgi:hypothetical protein
VLYYFGRIDHMPIYIAELSSCDCTPVPDMAFRADDMVSAVMVCQEKIEVLRQRAKECKIEMHDGIEVVGIQLAEFELMDDEGIESVVDFWQAVVAS